MDLPAAEIDIAEKGTYILNMTAHGNPSAIAYKWKKNGNDVSTNTNASVYQMDAVLNFTSVRKEDAGLYTCEASNSQGKATFSFNVTIQCKFSSTQFRKKIHLKQ